jgi:hypothetical protein
MPQQATKPRIAEDIAGRRRAGFQRKRNGSNRLIPDPLMGRNRIVVVLEFSEQEFQAFAKDHEMVRALVFDRLDEPLRVCVQIWRRGAA